MTSLSSIQVHIDSISHLDLALVQKSLLQKVQLDLLESDKCVIFCVDFLLKESWNVFLKVRKI